MDGCLVQLLWYATLEDCNVLTDAIQKFEPAWDQKFRSISQLYKVPNIKELLGCEWHFRKTEYTVEFRVRGQPGCNICLKLEKTARTPNVVVDSVNLQEEILCYSYMTLPVPDKDDNEHFLPPARARLEAQRNNLTRYDLVVSSQIQRLWVSRRMLL